MASNSSWMFQKAEKSGRKKWLWIDPDCMHETEFKEDLPKEAKLFAL